MTIPTVAIFDKLGSHVGFHYYVNSHAEALAELGYEVTVYGYNNAKGQATNYKGINAFRNLYGTEAKWKRGLRLLFQLISALISAKSKRIKVAIIHLFKYEAIETAEVSLFKIFGIKIIAIVHDIERLDRASGRDFSKYVISQCANIIVHNNFSKERLLTLIPNIDSKVAVAPHGNYLNYFRTPPSKSESRERLSLSQDITILLFFGSSRPLKGLHILIDALAQHRDRDFLLVIAGTMKTDYKEEMAKLISAKGLSHKIRIDSGRVNDDDVAYYYRASDLVALPYLQVYESGVALMAMSLGRPVIASDLPPFADLVGDGKRGILFEAGSAESLSLKLTDAFVNFDLLDQAGKDAYDFVKEYRTWHQSAVVLDSVLRAI